VASACRANRSWQLACLAVVSSAGCRRTGRCDCVLSPSSFVDDGLDARESPFDRAVVDKRTDGRTDRRTRLAANIRTRTEERFDGRGRSRPTWVPRPAALGRRVHRPRDSSCRVVLIVFSLRSRTRRGPQRQLAMSDYYGTPGSTQRRFVEVYDEWSFRQSRVEQCRPIGNILYCA